jgi:hypothetical protein
MNKTSAAASTAGGIMNLKTFPVMFLLVAPAAHAQADTAHRFGFSSVAMNVAMVKRSEKIAMKTPPSDPIPEKREPRVGSWFEVRDAAGKTLYLRVVHDMLGLVSEAPGTDGKPTSRTKASPKNTFELVVPDVPGARDLVLFASPDLVQPATEVARFKLDDSPPR